MSAILKARGIAHSFVGHPSMSGLYFAQEPAAQLSRLEGQRLLLLRRRGARCCTTRAMLCEPDSREPWFVSAAHDESCLTRHACRLRGRGRYDTTFAGRIDAQDVRLSAARAGRYMNGDQERETSRRHRRGRRPQRPGGRLLPRARRTQGAGAGAQSVHRRRGRQPQPVRGLHLLELLLRVQSAAHRDHPRARTADATACRSSRTRAAAR